MKNNYYVYEYIRPDGTPYYIGKGSGNRAFIRKNKRGRPIDNDMIRFIKKNLSEGEALELEKKLIKYYGRKDLGTGILINLTDGGEGISNPSSETRYKMSLAKRNESKETRNKRSLAAKNRLRNPLSEETKQKISLKNRGKTRSASARSKMSAAKIGKPSYVRTEEILAKQRRSKEKVVCSHCGKIGGISSMSRWHFDKCKLKDHSEIKLP